MKKRSAATPSKSRCLILLTALPKSLTKTDLDYLVDHTVIFFGLIDAVVMPDQDYEYNEH